MNYKEKEENTNPMTTMSVEEMWMFNRNQYPIRLRDRREDRSLLSVGGSLVFSQYLDDKVLQEFTNSPRK